jgi:hypothetical protein
LTAGLAVRAAVSGATTVIETGLHATSLSETADCLLSSPLGTALPSLVVTL